MESENLSHETNNLKYISLIGSAISTICFFAPWIGCGGETISGASIGKELWLIFASSLISFLSFLFFNSSKALYKAKSIITISSLIGLIFLIYNYIRFQTGELHSAMEIKWGSIATLIGFVVSIVGVSYLKYGDISNVTIASVPKKHSFDFGGWLNNKVKITGKWYYILHNEPIGPIEGAQITKFIRNGIITMETKVWKKGMPGWLSAADTEIGQQFKSVQLSKPTNNSYCGNCGSKLSPDVNYCNNCGSKIRPI